MHLLGFWRLLAQVLLRCVLLLFELHLLMVAGGPFWRRFLVGLLSLALLRFLLLFMMHLRQPAFHASLGYPDFALDFSVFIGVALGEVLE